ncbi:exported hypothetical protein [Gammaproteobacteria bacterium]
MKKLLFSLMLLWWCGVCHATVYHVCAGACDYHTTTEVNAATFTLDDVIYFKDETFAAPALIPKDSGMVGHEIIYASDPTNADYPIIVGGVKPNTKYGLKFIGLKTEAVDVADNSTWSFHSCHDITVVRPFIDCKNVLGNLGIQAFKSDGTGPSPYNIEISYGTIQNCGVASASQNGGGINFASGTHDTWTHHMFILDGFETGWQAYDNTHLSDAVVNNWITDSYVVNTLSGNGARNGINCGNNNINCRAERNFVSGYAACLEEDGYNSSSANSATFINNIATDCQSLILVAHDAQNLTALHNTLVAKSGGLWTTFYGVLYQGGGTIPMLGHVFKNNIVKMEYSASSYKLMEIGTGANIGLDSDYNQYFRGGAAITFQNGATLYTSLANWHNATGYEEHSKVGDPNLDPNYYPYPGSPAIGAGTPLSQVLDDYYGKVRSSTPTIGAREYSTGITYNGVTIR